MVASRTRPKGVRVGPFGLGVLALSLLPSQIGYQDVAALLIRQEDVSQRARAYALASPFGTIHAATFSFPRPVGTLIPQPPTYRLASLNAGEGDVGLVLPELPPSSEPGQYPVVNRRLKGDLLMSRPKPPLEEPEPTRDLTPGRVKTVAFPRPQEDVADEPAAVSKSDGPHTYSLASLPPTEAAQPDAADPLDPIDDTNPAVRLGRLYFGVAPVGKDVGPIEEWPDDQQVLIAPSSADPDIKRTTPDKDESKAGETVAPKGEVTGPTQRPKTPAERLGLDSKGRAKAEKCLAEAVYFESRGETKRGQIAVAQVVMNRVFSGYYPTTVCGVVYQNAHRYNACQFTFACDRVKEVVNEPDMWEQAKQISHDMLDGKLWLSEIGKSTHYHAYWVHPWWVRTMRKLSRIGVHTFYRPKRWGDGSDAPTFGPGITAENAGAAKL